MKIGLHFRAYEDCTAILYALSDSKFENPLGYDEFSFYYNDDEYIFTKHDETIAICDYKIRLFHTFDEWKSFKGYDKLIQTQTVENYHISNYELKEYLDAGNISLSSASISFEHPNFHYDPIFNLIFFYNHYGYNFLNYYKFDNKSNLLGVYYQNNKGGFFAKKQKRNLIFNKVYELLDNDLHCFKSNDYNLKSILQPYSTFGHWGNNHISSYTDYMTTVCNLVFETLDEDSNNEDGTNHMHKRLYITEKTLKTIIFSEANIFFIWYGPKKLLKHLTNLGFWFLNLEFYSDNVEESVYDSIKFLKELKEKYTSNKEIHEYLVNTYGHHLEKNVEIFNGILNSYNKKDSLLNLIKNGNRN
jgi:hypothetical protein